MPFYEIIQKMKIDNLDSLVLVHIGAFFEAVDLDAYIIHELFNLKISKYSNGIYKVGIPLNSIKKYVRKLNDIGIPFCIYDKFENSKDIIYMNNILENFYLNNEEGRIMEGKYDYIKIYDSNIEEKFGEDLNIFDEYVYKNVIILLKYERERRKIYEFLNLQNIKYIGENK